MEKRAAESLEEADLRSAEMNTDESLQKHVRNTRFGHSQATLAHFTF